MPETNDSAKRNATASWSGYLHQGKVGMLVALRKINELRSNNEPLDDWNLIYENVEDFDIRKGATTISRHQVKAYTKTGGRISAYTDALNDFDLRGVCADQCFLHVIEEVTKWSTSGKPIDVKKKDIKLWNYSDTLSFCPLLEKHLENWCFNEIRKIEPDINKSETIYLFLLMQLDIKIREAHCQTPVANPVLEFEEIVDLIKNSPSHEESLARLRRQFSEAWTEYKTDIPDIVALKGLSNNRIEWVDSLVNEIYSDDNFIEILHKIHPNQEKSYIEKTGIKDVFLRVLCSVDLSLNTDNLTFDQKPQYQLSAIIDDAERILPVKRSLVAHIKTERDLLSKHFNGTKLINRHIDYKNRSFVDIENKTSRKMRNFSEDKISDTDRYLDANGIELISRDNAINELNA